MKRAAVLLTLLGLLAATVGFGRDALSRWSSPSELPQPLLNAKTGEPLTLEAVLRDIDWHRETARKLRRLN